MNRLHGVYRSPDNRFEWDADVNPSPMRSGMLPLKTEHLPVLCLRCGQPFWPPMEVTDGYCSPACEANTQVIPDAPELCRWCQVEEVFGGTPYCSRACQRAFEVERFGKVITSA